MMKVVVDKSVSMLLVLGDSNILMDWENGKIYSLNMTLYPIITKYLEEKMQFEEVSFAHSFKEFISKADNLSKETRLMQEGTLVEQELRGNFLFDESLR